MNNSSFNHKTVAYAAGPGDVIGTFVHWQSGQVDPSEVAETYSGQFFQSTSHLGFSGFVIASHKRCDSVSAGQFVVEHFPKSAWGRSGLSYHLADIYYWLHTIRRIIQSNSAVAIISDMNHWWLLSILKLGGIKVVPTLHRTFWPKGFRPRGPKERLIHALNGWFWRHIPAATICISPECQRQAETIAEKGLAGMVLQARPKYLPGYFTAFTPPVWRNQPFQLLFAGRIETNKGVFDLVSVIQKLTVDHGLKVYLEVCGDGGAFEALVERVRQLELEPIIKLHGKLSQAAMLAAFQRCHVVVVPTTAEFAEGLNKVVVEGVLAGRPVIASS
ncbi:glycosyltransferase family 4 protein, partial [Methylicorpusculum sp.]|uniref:glycosyltransferase family 4 protein n=1 Tax=Methylicorpusculum sp. TaxID=2713644 RepID=UPI002AB7F4C7